MAEVLTRGASAGVETEQGPSGWWPVDLVILPYLAVTGLLIAAFFRRIPEAVWLVPLHAAGIALVWLAVKHPFVGANEFRHWYPLPYVASCYKEMAILIADIRRTDYDAQLAQFDLRIWGANPTVWLERITTPALTEFLQIVYSLFVPAVLVVAWLLWRQRRFEAFRRYAFLIALGFLVSYVGYFIVPARGPRFLLAHLQHFELRGLWSFAYLQDTLNRLESAHYDCFPSGHTELTILAWWGSRLISRRLFQTFSIYTFLIIFATVYLRYHYTVDILAGIVVAALMIFAAPRAYNGMRDVLARN